MVFGFLFGGQSNSTDTLRSNDRLVAEKAVAEANKGIFGYFFNNSSNSSDTLRSNNKRDAEKAVAEANKGIFGYFFNNSSNSNDTLRSNNKRDAEKAVAEANKGIFGYFFNNSSNSSDTLRSNNKLNAEKAVAEANKGIFGYFFNNSSNSDVKSQSPNENADNNSQELWDSGRGVGAAIMSPWRRYVVAPVKYLSSSTQFAVIDKPAKQWLFRLDKAHKGANYPHVNVNYKLTGVRDPHTRVPGAVVTASGPAGKVIRNAGDIVTIAAVGMDIYSIGSTARQEVADKGGVGIETGKVAAGIGTAWFLGAVGAALCGKAAAVAGGIVGGPVGAGVGGVLGAVGGGIVGSIKGRKSAEQFVEQHAQAQGQKCKL